MSVRRARHVITENDRTVEAAEALATGDAARMGELMNASHASLRDDFEVSSEALDVMVECARATAGCHGARMTGAGFGGCAVALAEAEAAEALARAARAAASALSDWAREVSTSWRATTPWSARLRLR